FAALSLVFTFPAARTLLPALPLVALAAVAIQAFIPQFLFISAAVSNDALAACMGAAVLWQAARVARGAQTPRDAMLLGALVGLSAVTKLSGAAFVLVALCALLIGAAACTNCRAEFARRFARYGMLTGLVAFVVGGWWYVRNLLLYADVTGLNRMLAIVGQHQPPLAWWQVLGDSEGLRLSFWGVFGWFSILLPEFYYHVYDALTLLALLGLAIALWRAIAARRILNPPRSLTSPLWLPPLAFLLITLGVFRWGSLTPGLTGRLLFPALGAMALLLGTGLMAQLPARLQRPGLICLACLMFALALSLPRLAIAPAYARPALLAAGPATPRVRFGDQIDLLGVTAPTAAVHPGDELPLTLLWRSAQPISKYYTLWLKLFGAN